MKLANLSIGIVLVFILNGCDGGPVPPPEPPDDCTILPDDCPFGLDEELCRCRTPEPDPEPDPEPPAPPDCPDGPDRKDCATELSCRDRFDYVEVEWAEDWRAIIRVKDNILINNGVRNVDFALKHCAPGTPSSVWPHKGIGAEEARRIRDRAFEVKVVLAGEDGESGFYGRLSEPHRRHGPERSRAFRPCLNEWLAQAMLLHEGCRVERSDGTCEKFWPGSNPQGPVAKLDGLRAICKEKVGI